MPADDCVFCKIARGEIPSDKVHDDGSLFAIADINPAAPVHLLLIPHKHIETLLELDGADEAMVGRVHTLAAEIARKRGFADSGYRVVANCNRDGGQSVYHIHFHLLAGRRLAWPPG